MDWKDWGSMVDSDVSCKVYCVTVRYSAFWWGRCLKISLQLMWRGIFHLEPIFLHLSGIPPTTLQLPPPFITSEFDILLQCQWQLTPVDYHVGGSKRLLFWSPPCPSFHLWHWPAWCHAFPSFPSRPMEWFEAPLASFQSSIKFWMTWKKTSITAFR